MAEPRDGTATGVDRADGEAADAAAIRRRGASGSVHRHRAAALATAGPATEAAGATRWSADANGTEQPARRSWSQRPIACYQRSKGQSTRDAKRGAGTGAAASSGEAVAGEPGSADPAQAGSDGRVRAASAVSSGRNGDPRRSGTGRAITLKRRGAITGSGRDSAGGSGATRDAAGGPAAPDRGARGTDAGYDGNRATAGNSGYAANGSKTNCERTESHGSCTSDCGRGEASSARCGFPERRGAAAPRPALYTTTCLAARAVQRRVGSRNITASSQRTVAGRIASRDRAPGRADGYAVLRADDASDGTAATRDGTAVGLR